MIMRCAACRRPLTNPVSIKHGFGPDCLKRAVKAGNAPLEALEQLTAWRKSRPKATPKAKAPPEATESPTTDLFANLREQAIAVLNAAADDCRAVGLTITIEIT